LKEEALDRIMWRARFGRGFGPVVRQTTKWMNELLLFVLLHDYCILHILTCMDASLNKLYALLVSVITYRDYHLRSEKQAIPLR
jgi:hypothetical protein